MQNSDTYDREITDPESGEKATVTLRPLSWGDVAKMNEIRFAQDETAEGGGVAKMAPGENKLLLVELALVKWTLPFEITRETIRKLNPLVGEQIYRHVDVGEAEGPKASSNGAKGESSGPLAVPAVQREGSSAETS
jgi:hypothetical protein